VTLISLDFSKAFDTVRHSTLADKLSRLDIPDCIYNWLVEFLRERRHTTKFQGRLSELASISASIVQGSGVGPADFVVNSSDLQPVHSENLIIKFADDSYLLVGSKMRDTVQEELESVKSWAEVNNLQLNKGKSREMIIHRRANVEPPAPLSGVTRVTTMKILGVTIRSDLRATSHVDEILASCSGSLHALRTLRSHGLSSEALQVVTDATTISRLLYAVPAWWGYTSAEDRSRIEKFLIRTKRMGYLRMDSPSANEMARMADDRLLSAVIWNEDHVLRKLFPPTIKRHYSLRPRRHDFILPTKDDKNFIPRALYQNLT